MKKIEFMIVFLADWCGVEIPKRSEPPQKLPGLPFLPFLPAIPSKMFHADDNNTASWVSKARSVLAGFTALTAFVVMLPAAFAHDAAPNFFFSTFIFIMTTMMSGHGNPNDGIRNNMPAYIGARYDAGAWAAGIISFLLLRFTGATVIQGFLAFIVWNVLSYMYHCHLDSIYGNDAVWARKHPEQAARIAADKARAETAYKLTQEYKDWEGFKFAMVFLFTSFIFFLCYIGGSSKKHAQAFVCDQADVCLNT
jgi:hypothetical protein